MQGGHYGLAEICLQKLKAFEKLSFLYFLLGDRTKLKKMMHVSKLLRQPLLRQQQALLLGDAEERVHVLMEAQQPGLAYLCAKSHGLHELAEQLRGSVDEKDVEEFLPKTPVALFPPLPILRFGPGETATWKPAVAGEVSAFASALRAVDAMDPETARLMLHRGPSHAQGPRALQIYLPHRMERRLSTRLDYQLSQTQDSTRSGLVALWKP